MKQSTLQHHKEATMLCEEGITTTKARNALSIPLNTKETPPPKTHSNTWNIDKFCINFGMTNHNVETCKKKEHITMATIEAPNKVNSCRKHPCMHAKYVV